jgi:hypothetical protein
MLSWAGVTKEPIKRSRLGGQEAKKKANGIRSTLAMTNLLH